MLRQKGIDLARSKTCTLDFRKVARGVRQRLGLEESIKSSYASKIYMREGKAD